MGKGIRPSKPKKRFQGKKSINSLGTSEIRAFHDTPGQIGGAWFCSNVILQTKTPKGKHVFVGWHMYPPHVAIHSKDPRVSSLEMSADHEGGGWLDIIKKNTYDWETDSTHRKKLKATFMKDLKKERVVRCEKALQMPPEAIIDVATEYLRGEGGGVEPIKATVIPGPVSVDGKRDLSFGSNFAIERVVDLLKGHDGIRTVSQRGMSKRAETSGAGWVFLDNKTGRIHRANLKYKKPKG